LALGMSRQNYYALRRLRNRRKADEGLIERLVRRERALQPRIGCRKLHFLLKEELIDYGIEIGRDYFFAVMSRKGLLVERKRGRARTTDSRHSLPVFRNLLQAMSVSGPNQAWVSDLTYVRTQEGFLYAALITDVFSRKIVGWHIGDSLEAVGCLKALEKALKELPSDKHPVHHSDRGCQYCCHEYVNCLRARGLGISMTEVSHCYENAMAERVNGILKQEYEMDRDFCSKEQATKAFKQAVWLYNHRRPHTSLGYAFPAVVHVQAA
jgi:putative transposase